MKDIEIVAVPRFFAAPKDMLGNPGGAAADMLTVYLEAQIKSTLSPWSFRLSKAGHAAFGPLNKLLLFTPPGSASAISLDLFTASASNWGRDMWVRTGPARWNQATATRALRRGMKFHAYGPAAFTRDGKPTTCATEEDFAAVLRMPCTPPVQRTDEAARAL